MKINKNFADNQRNRSFGISNLLMEESIKKLLLEQQYKATNNAWFLIISERTKNTNIRFKKELYNAQNALSLIQTAEGALIETHAILQRMRELTVVNGKYFWTNFGR